MFKSSFFSIFGAKKSTPVASGDIPGNFVVNKDNKIVNISMDPTIDDEFVNINCNELSYAEVARMNAHKPEPSVRVNTAKKQVGVKKSHKMDQDDMGDSIHEKFKSDLHYKKHKQFKAKQKMKAQRRGKKF